MSTQVVEIVVGCVVRDKGKFLLVQQSRGKAQGLWNIPAGHVDQGETLEQAALRETKEESGYDVSIKEHLGTWQEDAESSVKHAFYARLTSESFSQPDDEIQSVSWFDIDEIKTLYADGKLRADWVYRALCNADKGIDHDQHFVTTKVALFNADATRILVMQLGGSKVLHYGLPGGHLDRDETPDQAIVRELDEELGLIINPSTLLRTDFFLHDNGKVVLGYTGRLSSDTELVPSNPDKEIGVWVNHEEFAQLQLPSSYISFGLNHWPTA